MRKSLLLLLLTALARPAGAAATSILPGANTQNASIAVNRQGIALVRYGTGRSRRHVLLWGAINALPHPTEPGQQQVAFDRDFSGGWESRHDAGYWRTFEDACRPYDGPALPFFVAGCTAPDGSYWALQRWQRDLPMRGFAPWTARQRAYELHVSHWSGDLPVLEIHRHWTYGHSLQGFFGRFTYEGQPVYGTRSSSASVDDPWARNVYIDVYDSDYGPGWKHDTAIATHPGDGGFCYSFVAQPPPKGYPSEKPHGNGLGTRYRVSAMGPGVTPIVQWQGDRLGAFDAALQARATATFDQILGRDAHCAPER